MRIKSYNENIEYFLTHNENFKHLEKIANRDKFSPIIMCEKDDKWKIVAKYHLEFDDWTEPIEPIVAMYKELITEFHKRIANVSLKAYREMN
ncbi:hypothetical protein ACWGOQ_0019870 [Aquimarina sp. M1]